MLSLPDIFASHMVLQRRTVIPVWGCAPDGSTITVQLGEQCVHAVAAGGRWMVHLAPMEAATGLTMSIRCGDESLQFHDVAIGEVWIAGGQSNMAMTMRDDADYASVKANLDSAQLRFYRCPTPDVMGFHFRPQPASNEGIWMSCSAETLAQFSAVGYYFQSALAEALHIPVAIVACNVSGTRSAAWADLDMLRRTPEVHEVVAEWDEAMSHYDPVVYNAQADAAIEQFMKSMQENMAFFDASKPHDSHAKPPKQDPLRIPMGPRHMARPGGYFESMTRPLAPYACRGVIWYQGESDNEEGRERYFAASTRAVIASWRALWQRPEMPFLMVQLAPFSHWLHTTGEYYPILRAQQQQVADSDPNVWLACIMDAGEAENIHPVHKRPVGTRLALLARGKVYGEDILCQSPSLCDAERTGHVIRLHLSPCGSGLYAAPGIPHPLALIVEGISVPIDHIDIQGDTVTLTAAELAGRPCEVRYAWENYTVGSLYNSAGLPVFPFRVSLD